MIRTAKKLVETDRIVQLELELSSKFRPIPLSILVESDVPAIPESRGLMRYTPDSTRNARPAEYVRIVRGQMTAFGVEWRHTLTT